MTESYCIMVEQFLIDELWSKCEKFLNNPEIGEIEFADLDDLKQECKDGICQLWILMQDDELTGCFITSIGEASANVKVLTLTHLSGEGVKVWIKELDDKVSQFAKINGCKYVSITARRGFARLIPELKEAGTLYVKDLRRN